MGSVSCELKAQKLGRRPITRKHRAPTTHNPLTILKNHRPLRNAQRLLSLRSTRRTHTRHIRARLRARGSKRINPRLCVYSPLTRAARVAHPIDTSVAVVSDVSRIVLARPSRRRWWWWRRRTMEVGKALIAGCGRSRVQQPLQPKLMSTREHDTGGARVLLSAATARSSVDVIAARLGSSRLRTAAIATEAHVDEGTRHWRWRRGRPADRHAVCT